MNPALLAELLARRAAKRPTVLATRLSDGLQTLLPDERAGPALSAAATAALAGGRSVKRSVDDEPYFLDLHLPPWRLILVGAVHIAQSLAPMAAAFGIEPVVVDPRTSFATPERFPGVSLRHDWPDEGLATLAPDSTTAVVVLSHDPKLDDPALLACLGTDAFYVGALGSKRSHAARLERLGAAGVAAEALARIRGPVGLGAAGVTAEALARIRGPVGLAIGAVTTEEIALSILAEIVAVRRSGAILSAR